MSFSNATYLWRLLKNTCSNRWPKLRRLRVVGITSNNCYAKLTNTSSPKSSSRNNAESEGNWNSLWILSTVEFNLNSTAMIARRRYVIRNFSKQALMSKTDTSKCHPVSTYQQKIWCYRKALGLGQNSTRKTKKHAENKAMHKILTYIMQDNWELVKMNHIFQFHSTSRVNSKLIERLTILNPTAAETNNS